MNIVKAAPGEVIKLGKQGEKGITRVEFDLLLLTQQYGQGTVQLRVKRAGEAVVYPAEVNQSGNTATWDIGVEWTATAGRGYCELNWYVGDTLAKSEVYSTSVQKSLEGETMDDTPDPAVSYVEQVMDAAARAEDAARRAEDAAAAAVVNVKDFGAVGDGVTNDEQAIKDAFAYAVEHLPCEVYFPKGEYGILNGGITVEVPKGSGGLTVRGDGSNQSTIKYLKDWKTKGSWYAIRIAPVGFLDNKPTTDAEYLHDIVIRDLAVHDTDPINHAWHTDKGDPSTEETHGFDIQFCVRATVKDCFISNVGDEAIDIYNCTDVLVTGNHVVGSPAAGGAGGAISIGCGTENAVVSNNTVDGSNPNKGNFGIAIESLTVPVRNVVVDGNTIYNINGNGINIGATQAGSGVYGLVVSNNTISNINGNGISTSGQYTKNINISGCWVSDCTSNGMVLNYATSYIYDCIVENIGETGIKWGTVIQGCIVRNVQGQGAFVDGEVQISGCVFDGIALGETKPTGAIQQFSTTEPLEVFNTKLKNIQCNKGIHNATKVVNVDIQLAGQDDSLSGASLKYVYGGKINGRIKAIQNNGIIDGLTVESTENLWNAPIVLADKTGVIVTNCHIHTISYDAIKESGTSNNNIITNNVTKQGITKVGENTVVANNVQVTT